MPSKHEITYVTLAVMCGTQITLLRARRAFPKSSLRVLVRTFIRSLRPSRRRTSPT